MFGLVSITGVSVAGRCQRGVGLGMRKASKQRSAALTIKGMTLPPPLVYPILAKQ